MIKLLQTLHATTLFAFTQSKPIVVRAFTLATCSMVPDYAVMLNF